MAKILTTGKAPIWGTGLGIDGMIIDSFNITPEIKDYEQTDENGAVCGYLVYDQTVNYDLSGTLLKNDQGFEYSFGSSLTPNLLGKELEIIGMPFVYVDCDINTPNTIILKSFNISRSAGSAATFSASATGYSFDSKEL